jgi:hypothetical protein
MADNKTGLIGDGFAGFAGLANMLQKAPADNVGVFGEHIEDIEGDGHLSDEELAKLQGRTAEIAAAEEAKRKAAEASLGEGITNKKTSAGSKQRTANTPEEFLKLLEGEDGEKETSTKGDDGDGNKGTGEGGNSVDTDTVVAFCDVITEALGLEISEEEKPTDLDSFATTILGKLSEKARPEYANEELEALDAFVRQGGNIHDYYAADRELDIDSLKVEDSESDQKMAVRYLHRLQGIKPETSEKKIERLINGGLLKEEAADAVDQIKEAIKINKETLLQNQEKEYKAAIKQQNDFVEDVKTLINSTTEIYGVKLPDSDKQALMKFLFKPTAKGTTAYQEAFNADYKKNLIMTAHLLMKGGGLIETARQNGSTSAMEALKKKLLGSSLGKGNKSSGTAGNEDASAALSSFLRRL